MLRRTERVCWSEGNGAWDVLPKGERCGPAAKGALLPGEPGPAQESGHPGSFLGFATNSLRGLGQAMQP